MSIADWSPSCVVGAWKWSVVAVPQIDEPIRPEPKGYRCKALSARHWQRASCQGASSRPPRGLPPAPSAAPRRLGAGAARGAPRGGWAPPHDRAAGRTLVYLYVDRTIAQAAEVAAGLYAWLEDQARAMAELRGITESHLDASPFADDTVQREWLEAAEFINKRTWLHMSRPVHPDETVPALREGVTIRPVETHENGMPVAADLQTVHQTLEESFQDHFNSYRESFPEFVQRLREDPGHRWSHWWLAYVDDTLPAGSLVASVLPANAAGVEGTYVEYIGVNRNARGRGVAKGLLHAVIGDAIERGRDRVSLEVDADSPTGADGLYKSMGWVTDYVTESWHKDVTV
jgi:GNAT superfamily N-acetyltransferase